MPDPTNRYLVAPAGTASPGEQKTLEDVARFIDESPGASVVRRGPKRLVVECTPQIVNALQSRFGQQVIIEQDAPLRY